VFLKVLGSSTTSLAFGCGAGPAQNTAPIKAADVAVGQIVPLGNDSAFVVRDANGLYALSAICTHENCDMTQDGRVSGSEIVCNCHGSVFSASGAVVLGPARSPLVHVELVIAADGTLSANAAKTVPSDTRVVG
jgi:cytochrome b6-f complex iron-sulfur subunit